MRHAVLFSVSSGAAAVAAAITVAGTAPARPAAHQAASLSLTGPAGSAGSPHGRVVEYRGLRVPVPAGWEVYRLDRHPSRCVRYDRHAVYLGRPGPQPDCPARAVGRTEALHIQPAGGGRTARTVVHADKLASLTVPRTADHETRLTLPEAGVTITGVYGRDPGLLQRILRGIRLSGRRSAAPSEPDVRRVATAVPSAAVGATAPAAGPAPSGGPVPTGGPAPAESPPAAQSPAAAQGTALERSWARGKGFDTCTAPSLATMRAWRPSFKVTNIYIGGASRGCAQPNLTASWVRQVRAMGYRLTATYVGLQAPCGSRPQRFTAKSASWQGTRAAVDAARRARALGIPAGKPLYYDMEAYDHRKSACRAAVLRFVDKWVNRLKTEGYEPCLYSSVKSGIRDVGRSSISKPSCVWFANWDRRAKVYGDPFLPDAWWSPHRRVKQYRGGHRETHGGVTLNIDCDIADGRVY
ncbi:DUF1906 domain-containing protein [Actinomadura mexicana]|uniref:Rv2525c-like glycoside hydrolase-like domain-containing protein n=1 Tax=Actinomadura mexicana TaxID=134959 RepID=A0A238YL04_9ACTN|nr:DUF1906 domain-containing protein [Actinomadura mexicana]SNR71936.1 protein of unknown function [Actinomadura mexicana]